MSRDAVLAITSHEQREAMIIALDRICKMKPGIFTNFRRYADQEDPLDALGAELCLAEARSLRERLEAGYSVLDIPPNIARIILGEIAAQIEAMMAGLVERSGDERKRIELAAELLPLLSDLAEGLQARRPSR